jgi:hypothetical protein
MIDDQVNEEEIAASRKMRETAKAAEDAHAAQDATDDGMPAAPERKTASAVRIQYSTPRHWIKNAKKFFGAGDRT